MRRFLNEFWRGLTEPSLAAVGVAVALALSLFGICAFTITPAMIADGTFVTFAGDDEAALTAAALAQPKIPLNRVNLVLIGSSASREALENVHGVELRVGPLLGINGRDVTFRALTAGALTHVNAAALIDSLPPGFHGLVVLEISERNLALDQEESVRPRVGPRLPLDSPLHDQLLERLGAPPPRRTGNLFIDHHDFFLARPAVLELLWRGPIEPAFHQIDDFPEPTAAQWERIAAQAGEWMADYDERSPINLDLYQWLIGQLKARPKVGVALLQAMRNPDVSAKAYAEPAAAAMWARYRADVDALAARTGVPIWRIGEDAAIEGSMYRDGAHIVVPEGRRRFTEDFARRVADWCAATSCVAPERGPPRGAGQPEGPPRGPAPVKP